MTTEATDCQGTWHERYDVPEDGEQLLSVLKCSGCGDWMVIINYRGYDVKATIARTTQEAVREALKLRSHK